MILLFGSAGAGKSVQGKRMAAKHAWPWISVGELLRQHANDPRVGGLITHGMMVPDELVYELVDEAVAKYKGSQVILDGFPRATEQAAWLLGKQSVYGKIDVVIVLEIPPTEATTRLLARARSDDTFEAISRRIATYAEQVYPTIEWLESKGVPTVRLDSIGTEDEVQTKIESE